MTTPTALYRHFDGDGRLLYVGISLSAVARLAQHAHGSRWSHDIRRVDVEMHQTREAALAAERCAIVNEKPFYNKAVGAPFARWARPVKQAVHDTEILRRLSGIGESRADRAARLMASKLAPGRELTPSALGMWFTREEVPDAWRAAALDVLGLLPGSEAAA